MYGARVGSTGPQKTRLVKRLRTLSPPWSITPREARWIAERQARLLLADAGITAPPVPERIVSELAGVNVYRWRRCPSKDCSAPVSRAAAAATS